MVPLVISCAALTAGFCALPTRADTVHLRPVADTTLFEAAPSNNLGRVVSLAAGTTARGKRGRALLRFDLAGSVPANAIVASATLTITVVRATARRFGAREDTNSPPELRVEFNASVPPTPRLTGIQRSGSAIRFQFEAQPNAAYAVEYHATIARGTWSVLTNFAPAPSLRHLVVSDVPGSSNRFYRVLAR